MMTQEKFRVVHASQKEQYPTVWYFNVLVTGCFIVNGFRYNTTSGSVQSPFNIRGTFKNYIIRMLPSTAKELRKVFETFLSSRNEVATIKDYSEEEKETDVQN